jgi:hypothetical protein
MSYTINRIAQSEEGTFGTFLDENNNRLALTCEPPADADHPCIPAGTYAVVPHNSLGHPNTWEITNVPNRTEILIHNGNTIKDTLGCILVGDSFGELDGISCVLNSDATLNKLRAELPSDFSLTIIDQFN